MNAPTWVAVPVVVLGCVATLMDLRARRIPNALTAPAFVLGIGVHWVSGGGPGAVSAILGALLAGVVLFPGWMAKWMGAGDVKLMAAVGAWLGLHLVLYAVLASLLCGGLIAFVVAARRGILVRSLRNAAAMIPGLAGGTVPAEPSNGPRVYVPFALAVLAGSLFALWWPI